MNIREALIQQSPSLELQRAAANEIARLNKAITEACKDLHESYEKIYDLEGFLEDIDMWDEFIEWRNRNREE